MTTNNLDTLAYAAAEALEQLNAFIERTDTWAQEVYCVKNNLMILAESLKEMKEKEKMSSQ